MVKKESFIENSISQNPKSVLAFNFEAMLLKIFGRYCHQLILAEIFDMKYDSKQTFKYYFTENEIAYLGKQEKNKIIFSKKISTNYDFITSIFKKRCTGTININCEFIANDTLENSYYLIEINLQKNENFKLTPFFLNEIGYNKLISEFMNKLWNSILIQLVHPKRISQFKEIQEITTDFSDEELKKIIPIKDNQDLICDIFHIVNSYLNTNTSSNTIHISTDLIMRNRGLKENPNSKGCRSGYKSEQKHKINAILNLLNTVKLLNIIETNPFNYIISKGAYPTQIEKKHYPIKLVTFNLKTQIYERRIAFYLLTKKQNKIQIKKITNLIKNQLSSLKPSQLREKTEQALDKLCDEKIIKSWHYTKINEDILSGKNWLQNWENLTITCRY